MQLPQSHGILSRSVCGSALGSSVRRSFRRCGAAAFSLSSARASRPLSDELQCYAAHDVECCRALREAMRADLAAGGAAVKPAADELLARVRAASERRLGEYRDLEAAYPQTGGADPVAAKAPEI